MGLRSWLGGRPQVHAEARPAPAAASTKAVTAVMLKGGGRVHAVGESFYQDALRRCCGARGWMDVRFECDAVLVREPDNPHDANAVAVYAGGEKVAHLSRADAVTWRPVLEILAPEGYAAACGAMIAGRGPAEETNTRNLGIVLHLPTPAKAIEQICAELGLDPRRFYY